METYTSANSLSSNSLLTTKVFQLDQECCPEWIIVNPLSWLVWIFDLIFWGLASIYHLVRCLMCCGQRQDGLPTNNEAGDGPSNSPAFGDGFNKTIAGEAFSTYAKENALGTRKVLDTCEFETGGGDFSKLYQFGETQWITYEEFGMRIQLFGLALRSIGMQPLRRIEETRETDDFGTVLLYEQACSEWLVACLGCISQSVCIATCLANLNVAAVAKMINETKAKVVLCNLKDVEKLLRVCSGHCPSLKYIVFTTFQTTDETIWSYRSSSTEEINVITMDEFICLGSKHSQNEAEVSKVTKVENVRELDIEMGAVTSRPHWSSSIFVPCPDTTAMVMFTSGSCGKPKGALIKHSKLVASVGHKREQLEQLGLKHGQETYIANMSPAHAQEFVTEVTLISMGCKIGFGGPATLLSKGLKGNNLQSNGTDQGESNVYQVGAIEEFQPTFLSAAPMTWNALKQEAESLCADGCITRWLAQVAFTGRKCHFLSEHDSTVLGVFVFKRLAALLGGRLKVGMTAGPLDEGVQKFFRVMYNVPLLQSYGLAETTGSGFLQAAQDTRIGVVGLPAGFEFKLRSCRKQGLLAEPFDRNLCPYREEDKWHCGSPCVGRGEILVRGQTIAPGYFRESEHTYGAFEEQGWFNTGDVGVLLRDGSLMVVDRIPQLVKMNSADYIALETVEKYYSTCVYTDDENGGVLCYGNSYMYGPVALVQGRMSEIENLAERLGVTFTSYEDLASNTQVVKAVLNEFLSIAKWAQLGPCAVLSGIVIIPGTGSKQKLEPTSPWTLENGALTDFNCNLNRTNISAVCGSLLQRAMGTGLGAPEYGKKV